MKEKINTVIMILGTVLFFGLAYPEILLSDEMVDVLDEEGEEVDGTCEQSEDAGWQIEQLWDKITSDDDSVVYQLRFLELLDRIENK